MIFLFIFLFLILKIISICDIEDPGSCSYHGQCADSYNCTCKAIIEECQQSGIACFADEHSCNGGGEQCETNFQSCVLGCTDYFDYTKSCTGVALCCFNNLNIDYCDETTGVCDCVIGWNGTNCSIPVCGNKLATDLDVCSYGNGTCTSHDNCVCNAGWTGDECEIPDCGSSCNDHQTCTFNGTGVECICKDYWEGDTCDTLICKSICNSTEHKTCYYPETCLCDNGWYILNGDCLPVCSRCDALYADCTAPHTCVCKTGLFDLYGNGTRCIAQCIDPVCGVGEMCTWNGTHVNCTCKDGYYLNVTECVTECIPDCGSNQECVICNGADPACICKQGYFNSSGTCYPGCYPDPQIEHDCCLLPAIWCCDIGYYRNVGTGECDPDCCTLNNNTGCLPHYECVAPDTCNCTSSWNGSNCELPICDPSCKWGYEYCNVSLQCDCVSALWQGLECLDPVCNISCNATNFKECVTPGDCRCIDGYYQSEDLCKKIYICNNVESYDVTVCNGYGKCISDGVCQCNSGYELISGTCQPKKCNDVDWNNSTVCSSHGICDINTELCCCEEYWNGTNCEIPRCDCFLATNPLVCSAHGNCTAGNNCTCKSGWSGDICESHVCIPTCNVREDCNLVLSVATCECKTWWASTNCLTAYCSPVCGMEHRICTYPNNCICDLDSGFYENPISLICEEIYNCYGINSTNVSTVCTGHGVCVDNNTCVCDRYYNGSQCTTANISICFGINGTESSVCNRNGYCNDTDICICDTYFNGTQCEIDVSPVCYAYTAFNVTLVCSGNGICVATNTCVCDIKYEGDNCETYIVPICNGIEANTSLVCDGSGECVRNFTNAFVCKCNYGYKLVDNHCVLMNCNGIVWYADIVCSDNGNCTIPEEVCDCNNGWYGDDCEIPKCDNLLATNTEVCNGRGDCIAQDSCSCTVGGWGGTFCEIEISECNNCTVPDPLDFYCKDINDEWRFYNLSQACGPNGNCIIEEICLCECMYYGNICQYRHYGIKRIKYCLSKNVPNWFFL